MKKSILCIWFVFCSFSCSADDFYTFSVGNIIVNIPNEYSCGYYDGIRDKYFRIDNKEITGNNFNKNFSVLFFRKDGNFEDPDKWGYGVNNLLIFTNYINGLSEINPKFFVRTMRRNKFKNINICETLTLGRFEVFDKIFEHQIIFMDDDYFYCIAIQMWGNKFQERMMQEMPEYFNLVDGEYYGAWISEKHNEIIDKFDKYQLMPMYLNELFIETNNIFNNIIIK
jgi:hypothetical protein